MNDRAPVLVCGLGHFGYRAVELLLRLGERVTVVTLAAREEWRRAVVELGAEVLVGDARDARTLERAGLAKAKAVLALTDADLVNIEIALDARRMAPEVPVVVRLFDRELARQLEQGFGIRRALAVSTLSAPAFAGAALGERTVAALDVGGRPFVVAKHTVDPASPVAGLPLRELAWRHRMEVVARRRAGESGADLPDPDERAEPGDQLFLLGEKSDWLKLAHAAGRLEPRPPRTRRPFREATAATVQLWKGTPAPMRSVFLGLVSLMLVSVVVFSLALKLPLVDAVYFVVETVTTTGYGDISPLHASLAVKLYACLVMLLGSAALVTFTSIVTAYAVAERFRGRRMPPGDHVIVAGMGNLGLRTVEEVARQGAEPVAVDRDPGRDLLAAARGIAPVVLGDARAESVLLEARVREARAVVAVTEDDAANLGIALSARRLNPRIRTVVRLFDGDFARKVEGALEVDAAIGAAPVAAPLFVACALAPRVAGAFLAGSALVALVEETVGDERAGITPERLRTEAGLHVLFVREPGGAPRAPQRGEPLPAGCLFLAARRWNA